MHNIGIKILYFQVALYDAMYVAHFHDAFADLYADPIGPVTVHKQKASMFVLNIFSLRDILYIELDIEYQAC